MVGTFAFLLQCSRKRQWRPGPPVYLDASRLVVSVVDCDCSWRDRCLAKNSSTARARILRSVAALLDGGRFSAAAAHRPASGLLFDEHVERVRYFCRDRVGTARAKMATRRR